MLKTVPIRGYAGISRCKVLLAATCVGHIDRFIEPPGALTEEKKWEDQPKNNVRKDRQTSATLEIGGIVNGSICEDPMRRPRRKEKG